MESDDGAVVIRPALPYDLHFGDGFALGILLHKDLPFAMHLCNQQVRQGVHAGNAHAVQTAGHLVVALAELTAGMEHGEHDLESGAMLLFVHAGRNASAIILHPN